MSGELFDQSLRYRGGEESTAVGDDADGGDQLDVGGIFKQEATGAGREGFVHVLVEVESGEHENAGRLGSLDDAARRFDSVQVRHPDVHQDDVRVKFGDGFDCFEPVGCLSDDLDVGFFAEDHAEAGANEPLVVCKEDANGHASSVSSGNRARTE